VPEARHEFRPIVRDDEEERQPRRFEEPPARLWPRALLLFLALLAVAFFIRFTGRP
jgi:hypothetical protein